MDQLHLKIEFLMDFKSFPNLSIGGKKINKFSTFFFAVEYHHDLICKWSMQTRVCQSVSQSLCQCVYLTIKFIRFRKKDMLTTKTTRQINKKTSWWWYEKVWNFTIWKKLNLDVSSQNEIRNKNLLINIYHEWSLNDNDDDDDDCK